MAFDVVPGQPAIRISQRTMSMVVGCGVWNAGVALPFWLQKNPHLVKGKSVLELGAGCGQGGIAASLVGAKAVLATDIEEVIQHLQYNVERNSAAASNVSTALLHWEGAVPQPLRGLDRTVERVASREEFDDLIRASPPSWPPAVLEHRWDVVMCADCCYGEDSVVALTCTLQALKLFCGTQVVIMAHDDRNERATALLAAEMEKYWDCTPVNRNKVAKALPPDSDPRLLCDGQPVPLRCEESLHFYVLRVPFEAATTS